MATYCITDLITNETVTMMDKPLTGLSLEAADKLYDIISWLLQDDLAVTIQEEE